MSEVGTRKSKITENCFPRRRERNRNSGTIRVGFANFQAVRTDRRNAGTLAAKIRRKAAAFDDATEGSGRESLQPEQKAPL